MDLLRRMPYLRKGGIVPVGFPAAENPEILIDYSNSGLSEAYEVIETQFTEVIPGPSCWSSHLSYYFRQLRELYLPVSYHLIISEVRIVRNHIK
jgi:hypothetical protein